MNEAIRSDRRFSFEAGFFESAAETFPGGMHHAARVVSAYHPF